MKNLLFEESEEVKEEKLKKKEEKEKKLEENPFQPTEMVPHYRPKIYVYFIKDSNVYPKG